VIHKLPDNPDAEQDDGEKVPREWAPAGAALLELERRGLMPAFACAADERLERAGKGAPVPPMLAWIHDQAMLLAPWEEPDGWHGHLIAEPEASGQALEFSGVDGERIVLQLPALQAVEGVLCDLPQAVLPIAG
jgi:hypothetical protein